jgi:hypothetical protein
MYGITRFHKWRAIDITYCTYELGDSLLFVTLGWHLWRYANISIYTYIYIYIGALAIGPCILLLMHSSILGSTV